MKIFNFLYLLILVAASPAFASSYDSYFSRGRGIELSSSDFGISISTSSSISSSSSSSESSSDDFTPCIFYASDSESSIEEDDGFIPVLVIIDMQYGFSLSGSSSLCREIVDKIKKAMAKNTQIIFINYENRGNTVYELLKVVLYYKNVVHLKKNNDGGGPEILAHLDPHSEYSVELCGIYTGHCVHQTALQLCESKNVKKVCIDEYCCAQTSGLDWQRHVYNNRQMLQGIQKDIDKFGYSSKFKIDYDSDNDF